MDGDSTVLTDLAGRSCLLLGRVTVQGADYAVVMPEDSDTEAQIVRLLPGGRCEAESDDETRSAVFEQFLLTRSDLFDFEE
jgi:hypothetical protein